MRQTRSLPRSTRRAGRHRRWPHDRHSAPSPAAPPPVVAALPPSQVWRHVAPDLQARLRQTLRQVLQEVICNDAHR